jgi:hypothetical protein
MPTEFSKSTLLILLGAQAFPHSHLSPSESFLNSRNGIKAYFLNPKAFGLEEAQVLDLFESDANGTAMLDQIENWLIDKLSSYRNKGTSLTDIIIYYVGHGGLKETNNDYYLAIKSTKRKRPYFTSLPMEALSEVIKENLPRTRKYYIIDACFAGSAAKNIQNADQLRPTQAKIKEVMDSTYPSIIGDSPDPDWGSSLLAATSPDEVAKFGDLYTKFSEALIDTLNDRVNAPPYLTLQELAHYTKEFMKKHNAEDGMGLPEIHSPDQTDGDVRTIKIFPRQRESSFPTRIMWCDGKVMVLIEKDGESFYIDECPVTREQFDNWSCRLANLTLEEARQRDKGYPRVSVGPLSAIEYATRQGKSLPRKSQWECLIKLGEGMYDSLGCYKGDDLNLSCKISCVRHHSAQHTQGLWDIVGNTYEIVQDDTGSSQFYQVSSGHSSGSKSAFNNFQSLRPNFAHPEIGFRTVVLTDAIDNLKPAFITLE